MATSAPLIHREPRVDAYIAKSAPFARPILAHVRDVVHAACPEVEETIKWSAPFFLYRGGNLCHMAAFKQHCAFGFWREKEIPDFVVVDDPEGRGSFGRIGSIDDLPPKRDLTRLIRAAMKLNEAGPPKRAKGAPKEESTTPADFAKALAASTTAGAAFEDFSPSARREYVEWIDEAKRPATRVTRIATAIEWISEGKKRNWKYER